MFRLAFGPKFHKTAASRQGKLYPTRRAAAQELVHHGVDLATIRLLLGHKSTSNMLWHYARNNSYLVGDDGTTLLQLGTDLGGPILRINESLVLSTLPASLVDHQAPITSELLVSASSAKKLPADLAAAVAPVAEQVRIALTDPDASRSAAAAAWLQQRLQQQIASDREALRKDHNHLLWIQRAVACNVDHVKVHDALIGPLCQLQTDLAKAKDQLRQWLPASPALPFAVPDFVISQYVPFILGRWSLAHKHLSNPSGEPSAELQALLDASKAQQVPSTTPQDVALQKQQVMIHVPVLHTGGQRAFGQAAGGQGNRRSTGCTGPALPQSAGVQALKQRIDRATFAKHNAIKALVPAAGQNYPALVAVLAFIGVVSNPEATIDEVRRAAAALPEAIKEHDDVKDAILQGASRVVEAIVELVTASGDLQHQQEHIAPRVDADTAQQTAAQFQAEELAAKRDQRQHEKKQKASQLKEQAVVLRFHEASVQQKEGDAGLPPSSSSRQQPSKASGAGASKRRIRAPASHADASKRPRAGLAATVQEEEQQQQKDEQEQQQQEEEQQCDVQQARASDHGQQQQEDQQEEEQQQQCEVQQARASDQGQQQHQEEVDSMAFEQQQQQADEKMHEEYSLDVVPAVVTAAAAGVTAAAAAATGA